MSTPKTLTIEDQLRSHAKWVGIEVDLKSKSPQLYPDLRTTACDYCLAHYSDPCNNQCVLNKPDLCQRGCGKAFNTVEDYYKRNIGPQSEALAGATAIHKAIERDIIATVQQQPRAMSLEEMRDVVAEDLKITNLFYVCSADVIMSGCTPDIALGALLATKALHGHVTVPQVCGPSAVEAPLKEKIAELETEIERLQKKLIVTTTREEMGFGISNAIDEIERLRAEVAEWKHRVIGGTCRILSEGDKCNCALCIRDAEIEKLRTTEVDRIAEQLARANKRVADLVDRY